MAKGGDYEWVVAKQLSLWATGGRTDSWYGRSSGSGARATVRGRKGKETVGHAGDICANCAEAEFLTKFVTIEAKRGYSRKAFLADLIDRNVWPSGKWRKETMLGMIEQAQAAAKLAGTKYWMLIHRRDKREAIAYVPIRFFWVLGIDPECDFPQIVMMSGVKGEKRMIVGMRFDVLLKTIRPLDMKRVLKRQ